MAAQVDAVEKVTAAVAEASLDSSSAPNATVTTRTAAAVAAPNLTGMSNAQLMQYFQTQERVKLIEKYQKMQAKEREVKEHKFWNTQPVPQGEEDTSTVQAAINPEMTVAEVRQEPLNMVGGFEWCSVDLLDPAQLNEVYNLLTRNYVEDDDCNFRFDYSVPFLQWALTPPGFLKDWHVGVRNIKTGALMGFITAVPVHVHVHDVERKMAEINFLCVHKKLRDKRLAPVLIKEITRRVNLTDTWQAVYTAGVVLPRPVGKCTYYHRSLQVKKLIEVKFSHLPPTKSMQSHIKSLKLPQRPKIESLRPMTPEDVPGVHALLTKYLAEKTKLSQVFSKAEIAHLLLPVENVVNSLVIETEGKITDLCSFYHLPSTIIGNTQHNKLNAVYSYYNVATTVSLVDLMTDSLIFARNLGADVFNALDLMENKSFLEELQFGRGSGNLQYYLYNWKCPQMESSDVGIVLV